MKILKILFLFCIKNALSITLFRHQKQKTVLDLSVQVRGTDEECQDALSFERIGSGQYVQTIRPQTKLEMCKKCVQINNKYAVSAAGEDRIKCIFRYMPDKSGHHCFGKGRFFSKVFSNGIKTVEECETQHAALGTTFSNGLTLYESVELGNSIAETYNKIRYDLICLKYPELDRADCIDFILREERCKQEDSTSCFSYRLRHKCNNFDYLHNLCRANPFHNTVQDDRCKRRSLTDCENLDEHCAKRRIQNISGSVEEQCRVKELLHNFYKDPVDKNKPYELIAKQYCEDPITDNCLSQIIGNLKASISQIIDEQRCLRTEKEECKKSKKCIYSEEEKQCKFKTPVSQLFQASTSLNYETCFDCSESRSDTTCIKVPQSCLCSSETTCELTGFKNVNCSYCYRRKT
eukprot:g1379.t1